MFTFSPGFEAATLKIPNKEYTAYNGITTNRSFPNYNGPDPYNLMTVHSGGVLVDGREGAMASWSASMSGDEGSYHMPGANAPPRKQIIGFAKFRNREAALEARDVLQGRRIDIEKGAVLKAEMAKKNLHTKRGVGPLPNNGMAANSHNIPVSSAPPMNHPTSLSVSSGVNYGLYGGHPNSIQGEPFGAPSGDSLFLRERESLASMGRLWREPQQEVSGTSNAGPSHLTSRDQDEEMRRREVALNVMNFKGITRGPRERAAEEEKKLRPRISNPVVFDALHTTRAMGPSRQSSGLNGYASLLLPPETENGPVPNLGSSPSFGFAAFSSQAPQTTIFDGASGSWDSINKTLPAQLNEGSQRSSSPSLPPSSILHCDVNPSNGPTPKNNDTSTRQIPSEDTGSSVGSVTQSFESELSQKVDSLALNTVNGHASPQLPSPASGASSGSTKNAVDQNPPVCT